MYCQPAWKAWSCHPEVLSCRLQPNTLLSAAHLMTQEEQGRCANVSKLLPKQREVLVPTVTICFGALAGCTLYTIMVRGLGPTKHVRNSTLLRTAPIWATHKKVCTGFASVLAAAGSLQVFTLGSERTSNNGGKSLFCKVHFKLNAVTLSF